MLYRGHCSHRFLPLISLHSWTLLQCKCTTCVFGNSKCFHKELLNCDKICCRLALLALCCTIVGFVAFDESITSYKNLLYNHVFLVFETVSSKTG